MVGCPGAQAAGWAGLQHRGQTLTVAAGAGRFGSVVYDSHSDVGSLGGRQNRDRALLQGVIGPDVELRHLWLRLLTKDRLQ